MTICVAEYTVISFTILPLFSDRPSASPRNVNRVLMSVGVDFERGIFPLNEFTLSRLCYIRFLLRSA